VEGIQQRLLAMLLCMYITFRMLLTAGKRCLRELRIVRPSVTAFFGNTSTRLRLVPCLIQVRYMSNRRAASPVTGSCHILSLTFISSSVMAAQTPTYYLMFSRGPNIFEIIERHRTGGCHPVGLNDIRKNRYCVKHKLGNGPFATIRLARNLCRYCE
jgi:hypothetical protein